jgi:hypothetical protein
MDDDYFRERMIQKLQKLVLVNNIDQFLFFWTHVDTSSAANAHRGPTLLAHGRVEVGHDVGAAW